MTTGKRLIVVTGASRGLGLFIADKFWEAGDSIVLVARNKADLENIAQRYKNSAQLNQEIYYFNSDLSNLQSIPDLMNKIRDNAGDPDILVNNAAIQGPIGPVQTNDWDQWQACLNVCLLAPVMLCRGFLSAMIDRHYGRIINISGGGATSPRPNFSSYATAKCGLVRFGETLAKETASLNITVNCVSPGAMNSDLTRQILNAGKEAAGTIEFETSQRIVHEKPLTQSRAADLVYFLTTDPCAGISGKLISAVWDRWESLPGNVGKLDGSDVYTLRRIVPEDRNLLVE